MFLSGPRSSWGWGKRWDVRCFEALILCPSRLMSDTLLAKLRGLGLMCCEIKYSLFALHPSRATRIISTLTIICSYQHTYTLLLIKFHDVFVSRVPEYWDCWELHNNWIELHQYRYRIHRVSPLMDYRRGFNYNIKHSLENRCGLNFYQNFYVFTLYTLNS